MVLKSIELSLRQRELVLLATLLLVGMGVWSALRLPIDSVPDITNPQVLVNTAVPALAPEEIEKLVTLPIESQMAGLPGMIELRSLSKFGLSQVRMTFEDGVDLYRIRQLVSERLLSAAEKLPPDLQPRLAPIRTVGGRRMASTPTTLARLNRTNDPSPPAFQIPAKSGVNPRKSSGTASA